MAVVLSVLSMKSVRAPREAWRKWPRAALLGASATLAALLLWGSLGGDDGITEVLAHRSEVLPGRFIEVPCSEDYDSHRRFEGTWAGRLGCRKEQHVCVQCSAFNMHVCCHSELVGSGWKWWKVRQVTLPLPQVG